MRNIIVVALLLITMLACKIPDQCHNADAHEVIAIASVESKTVNGTWVDQPFYTVTVVRIKDGRVITFVNAEGAFAPNHTYAVCYDRETRGAWLRSIHEVRSNG